MAAMSWKLEQELEQGRAPAWPQGGHDMGVLKLLRLRDQMKQQLMEYSAAVRGGQTTFLDQVVEEKHIQGITEDLQINKEEIEVSFWNKTLALQRIQLMAALRNKVNQDGKDSCLILETVNRIALLSRTIIKYQQLAHEKKQKLIDIKRKRVSLKKDQRRKLQQIQTMKKKQKKEKGNMNLVEAKMLQNLEEERLLTTVIQNVFQNIIIGSGVNWAEDPSLKAIVLQLEKNVHLP
ncbi:centromere protein H [Neopelma chrysocephalum]|uniref:centromere protein H n=1 Tax=Neopelma chrysocephalum TaxID=114329 RepID=UPI000FCD43C4|nr:centromere protein H [Neopelma chrysocephalum]XP_027527364.1 centromere protein H [Neopelma chrysocephalum]